MLLAGGWQTDIHLQERTCRFPYGKYRDHREVTAMRYTKQKVKETLMIPEEVMRERRHAWLAESWARYQDEQRHKPKPISIAAEWEKEHPGKEFGGGVSNQCYERSYDL